MDTSFKIEGDINLTDERKKWQAQNLNSKTIELIKEDANYYFHQSLSTPCLNTIEKADGIYIYDGEGRKYMDFHGNSVHQIGYNNQTVMKGLKEQMDTLSFIPRRYTNEVAVNAAKKLVGLTNHELTRVLFTPSGSQSIGLALKIMRKATGKFKTVSLWDSFHGAGLDVISIGGEKIFRSDIGPLTPGTEHIMPYNSYRCIFGECQDCGFKCLDYLDYILEREGDVGGIILEPIRATDVQVPPAAYFKKLKQICDKYGVLLIFDEIPTAFGRTGEFYVYQNFGIIPDILVIGKGIGAGIIPISAVLVREELNVANDVALGHYTHEKSALGCRAILETIDYIESNHLIAHVKNMEVLLIKEFDKLKNKYEFIGDYRIKGLLFAIELVTNRETKEKAVYEAEKTLYSCLNKGLSFKVSQGNVLTFGPPLIITEIELLESIGIIEASLVEVFSQ
ncbi:MAG: aspartate aminotransferase family protein [Anaerocolumna sp.]